MGYVSLTIRILFTLCYLVLVLRALSPWLDRWRNSRWLYQTTDWLLNPIRAGLPPEKIGMDVSPYVAIILLYLIEKFFFIF
jgi:uncharacterized protein YggT (Ycf19 family)